jgi:hypothetical protein
MCDLRFGKFADLTLTGRPRIEHVCQLVCLLHEPISGLRRQQAPADPCRRQRDRRSGERGGATFRELGEK